MSHTKIDKIYASFKDDSRGWLSLHQQHFRQFVTIILAILAASFTALYNLKNETWLLLFVALGPSLNIILAILAIRVCNKFYLRYWDHELISYKLYEIMDEDLEISAKICQRNGIFFPEDTHLFPPRWLNRIREEDRGCKYETADQFAKARLTDRNSSNWSITIAFRVLILFSALVAFAILVTSIVNFIN